MIKTSDGQTKLVWRKVETWHNWAALSEGCYMLRTNINDWSGEELWKAYIQLTEAETAFRIHKSDLKIRPVWHQKTERVQAHIAGLLSGVCSLERIGAEVQRCGAG